MIVEGIQQEHIEFLQRITHRLEVTLHVVIAPESIQYCNKSRAEQLIGQPISAQQIDQNHFVTM